MPSKKTNPHLDLTSTAFIAAPYPTYQKLRERDGPYWFSYGHASGFSDTLSTNQHADQSAGKGMWLFSRYTEVNTILQESHAVTNNITAYLPEQNASAVDQSMLQSDPPEHGRRRKLVSHYFTHQKLRSLEPRIKHLADHCINQVYKNGGMEFIEDFANRMPLTIICDFMGIPEQDRSVLHLWSQQLTAGLDYISRDDNTCKQQKQALENIHLYFSDWLKGLSQPHENSISADLLSMYRSTNQIDKAELLSMLLLLLIGGHENLSNTFGNGLLALLQHPEQKRLLTENMKLMDSAIDEILRYAGPLQRANLRIATENFRIGDNTFVRGDHLTVLLASANRDAAQFANADNFDIRRRPNKHLAFGSGIHTCLGASLAKMQLRTGYETLFHRLPEIQLASDSVQWKHNTLFRGLKSLPVNF